MEKESRTIVFASHNAHKTEEMRRICGERFRIVSLADLGCDTDIPENGLTLEENAEAKVRWVYERYGMECFADDTGLEVDALGGAPGVHTARFAGPECDTRANVDLLLERLRGVSDRRARFRTVICLILGGEEHFFEGIVEGRIAERESGTEGFGYDPLFVPDGSDRSFARMSAEEKNALSHRGRAVRRLADYLHKLTK